MACRTNLYREEGATRKRMDKMSENEIKQVDDID
jgi:hypothetical protein